VSFSAAGNAGDAEMVLVVAVGGLFWGRGGDDGSRADEGFAA